MRLTVVTTTDCTRESYVKSTKIIVEHIILSILPFCTATSLCLKMNTKHLILKRHGKTVWTHNILLPLQFSTCSCGQITRSITALRLIPQVPSAALLTQSNSRAQKSLVKSGRRRRENASLEATDAHGLWSRSSHSAGREPISNLLSVERLKIMASFTIPVSDPSLLQKAF